MQRTKISCPECDRLISASNLSKHLRSHKRIRTKPTPKIRGVDYDPNAGYKDGSRSAWNKGKRMPISAISFSNETVFVENSTYARHGIKRRILRDNLIPHICAGCDIPPIWNGKFLSLHLEHKNGIRNDHRLENLEFLCPNCHSQTETYAGKNKGTYSSAG